MTPGVVAESDLAGTLKSEYVFFDREGVARRDGATGAGGVFYYFSDHLKTASVITNSAGVIKAESDYYPWGGELQFVNNDTNDYKFTGKKRDSETGLDYFGARYYSNGLGRWVSADWSPTPVPVPYADFGDPQSLNLYSYVRGLPTSRIGADGHCDWCHDAIDFVGGVAKGIVSSASGGAVGAPKSSDSNASLYGQLLGTAIEGGVSTDVAVQGAGTAGLGLVAEGPTLGGSTVLVVAGGGAAALGTKGALGAAKNTGAILNAMSKKGTEPGSRPGQDFTPAGKKEIDARDGNTCKGECGRSDLESIQNKKGQLTPSNQRQRHHIKQKSEGGSGTPENAKTLCPACHKEEHRKMREAKKNQNGS
jgi:RHS repeat-associated protein